MSQFSQFSHLWGPGGGPNMTDHENRFYGVFWLRRVRSISCFLPHQKILILAKVIAGQRSALMCNSIVRAIFNRDFQSRFSQKWPFFKLQNLSSPNFLSNYPETFKIRSRHENKDIYRSKFWFWPLNQSYEFLKFFGPKNNQKIRSKISHVDPPAPLKKES